MSRRIKLEFAGKDDHYVIVRIMNEGKPDLLLTLDSDEAAQLHRKLLAWYAKLVRA